MVADPLGRTGFLPSAGAIDAIDLQIGKVLWTTKAASRPLLVGGDQVVALAKVEGQKNTVRVVVLDASPNGKGKRVRECQPIELSDWLISRVPEIQMEKGDLLLRWHAARFVRAGKVTHWVHTKLLARINLATGRVDRLSEKDLPGPNLPKEIASITPDHYSYGEGEGGKPVIVVGKVAVVFDPFYFDQDTNGITKIALRRWDLGSGKELKPVPLLYSVGVSIHVSPDKRYGFVPIRDGIYYWTVFSLETGERVGTFTSEGRGDMGILGSRVYMNWSDEEAGKFLNVRDLKSEELLWTLRLQDGR
jgi:hypothetical protein